MADGIVATVWQACPAQECGEQEKQRAEACWEVVISEVLIGGSPMLRPWLCNWVPGLGLRTLGLLEGLSARLQGLVGNNHGGSGGRILGSQLGA